MSSPMQNKENNEGPQKPYKTNPVTRREYFITLERWLHDAHLWYNVTSTFPYMMMSNQLMPTVDQNGFVRRFNLASRCPLPYATPGLRNVGETIPSARPAQPVQHTYIPAQMHRHHTNAPRVDGVHCRIAPVWKRFVAEFLDFLILFFIKLAATFIAIDFFDFINLDKYGVELFTQALDYKSFVELTSEIVILEIIHRVVVCVFEAFWLQRGANGMVGGATPGKSLMGLRVIHCEAAVSVDHSPDVVIVKPGLDLGLPRSILRAVLKNFVLSVLFPVCIFLMFFKHNQTAYDVLSKSIVVEVNMNRDRP